MGQQIHQVFKQTAQLNTVQQVVQNTHTLVRPADEEPVDVWTKSLGKVEIYSSQRNSLPNDAIIHDATDYLHPSDAFFSKCPSIIRAS